MNSVAKTTLQCEVKRKRIFHTFAGLFCCVRLVDMIKRKVLCVGIVGVIFGVVISAIGFSLLRTAPSEDFFPIVTDPKKSFETSYEVCKDSATGARVYQMSFSGDDSGWASFYDENGKLIEATPEMGPGALNNLQPNTKVENCIRTTEKYFKTRVILK